MMFKSLERVCRVQLPLLRTQVAHFKIVLGQDQLYILLSCYADLWTVGQDLQSLLYLVVAGGYQFSLPTTSTRQTRQAAISLISFK